MALRYSGAEEAAARRLAQELAQASLLYRQQMLRRDDDKEQHRAVSARLEKELAAAADKLHCAELGQQQAERGAASLRTELEGCKRQEALLRAEVASLRDNMASLREALRQATVRLAITARHTARHTDARAC